MREFIQQLLQPLHLALLLTWTSVGLSLGAEADVHLTECWALLVAFLVASFLCDLPRLGPAFKLFLIAVEVVAALALIWLAPRSGAAPVLLVVLAAQLSMMWPLRRTVLTMLAIDLMFFVIVREAGYRSPLLVVMIYSGFQAFALLVGHYASRAERARDQLALVNADLLATRALLADSARNAERLRLARELHDVAGHKLTAMTLNLRALAADPALAGRDEVRIAEQLSRELLGDIRNVVQAIRDSRGLDLQTALRALAASMPKPLLEVDIDDSVRVDDPAQAEALLRLVQEALTNAARHAGATRVLVRLRQLGDELHVHIEDDGSVRGDAREGNGITGMRERIAALHGSLTLGRTPRGGLCIDASLPT